MSTEADNLPSPQEAQNPQSPELLEVKEVGPNTISAISVMGKDERLSGNVLRRICKLGELAEKDCSKECKLHEILIEKAHIANEARCADENLVQIISELGTKPENILMVGVTSDGVGFADRADKEYPYTISSKTDIKELSGYNAFFAREGDTIDGHEIVALGRRLADCGDINLEFADKDGKKVMGFMHMTKQNLQGEGALKHERSGQKVGSFEYFLRAAVEHYGADLSSMQIRVAAAIRPENYPYTFKDEVQMDDRKTGFPGWKNMFNEKGERFLRNSSNPDWKPGDPFSPNDKWTVDFEAMLRWQISKVTELQPEQINWEDAIDAGDEDSQHASNHRGYTNKTWNGRDAYFTAWKGKLSS